MKKKLMLIILVIAVLSATAGALTIRSSAKNDRADAHRYYRSVEITEGDTLWSISSVYADELGMNTKEYLTELKRVNGMESDRIIAGTKLVVICAVEE